MSKRHRGVLVLHPSVKVPDADMQALREAGYVPIRALIEQVNLRAPLFEVDGSVLTNAALRTIAVVDQRREQFGRIIVESALAQIGYALSSDGKTLMTRPRA